MEFCKQIRENFIKNNENIEKILKIKRVNKLLKIFKFVDTSFLFLIIAPAIYAIIQAISVFLTDPMNSLLSINGVMIYLIFCVAMSLIFNACNTKFFNSLILKGLKNSNIDFENFKDLLYLLNEKMLIKKEYFNDFEIDDKLKKIFKDEFEKYCVENNEIYNVSFILLKKDFEDFSNKLKEDIELKNKEEMSNFKNKSSINILEDFAKEENNIQIKKRINYDKYI